MPEIELDADTTAKTLQEYMADELAAERNQYDAMLAQPFIQKVMLYARERAEKAKEVSLQTLDPRDAARFEAWKRLGNGNFFFDALDWRLRTIRAEYETIKRIRELEAAGSRRKADRNGNALGEYGLYQSPGPDSSGAQPARG